MTRRCLLIVLFLMLGWLGSAANGAQNAAKPASAKKRPNIVLIMADDMGFECVGANGDSQYKTPVLDRLSKEGMRFTHCHSQPICTPSRVQIMTGIYNSRNYLRFGLLDPTAITFAHILKDAGYATCVVGKWQLKGGFEGPKRFGFDEYCLWQLTRRPNRFPNPGLEINGKEVDFKNGEYGPDIVTDYACDFIERHKDGDKPFFVYYPMMLPHWPFEPTPDSKEWDPKARVNDKAEKSGKGVHPKFFSHMVTYTDKMVGKLEKKLVEAGLRDNTLLIFTGDNGTYTGITSKFNGEALPGGKGKTTFNGTHVPLIAHWPGKIKAGQVCEDLIDFSDFLPTLASFAGAEVPKKLRIDGISFAPQLLGQKGTPRYWSYCWYYRNGKVGEKGGGEFARSKDYKLYLDGRFFDRKNDKWEKNPLDISKLTTEQRAIHKQLEDVVNRYTRKKRKPA